MSRLELLTTPHYRVSRVGEIPADALGRLGIRAVLLDVDNTLVEWHGEVVPPETAAWVHRLLLAGVKCCLLSNTHRPRRLVKLAKDLAIEFVPAGRKPFPWGYREAMARLGVSPAETAMIGDQLLTDILGGNAQGLTTILVDPISPREFWGTRVVHRSLERWLFRRMAKAGVRPAGLKASPNGTSEDQ